jgi:four helix bundle protein
MSKITSFRELLVWQKSMNLAERCYRVSKGFRRDDQLVLGYEIRKSCVSVPSNIAEGFGRHHTAEYIHHLRFSNGSNNELQTQVEIGKRVEIIPEEDAAAIIADAEEVGRMLHGLVNSLARYGGRGGRGKGCLRMQAAGPVKRKESARRPEPGLAIRS